MIILMKRLSALVFIILVTAIEGQSKTNSYGSAGLFELSTGFSYTETSNSPSYRYYSIDLVPHANHFLFNKWFLKYDLGLNATFYGWAGSSDTAATALAASPGLAIGHSFELTDRWHLNFSAGYLLTAYTYIYNNSAYNTGGFAHSGAFYPELKYLIGENWAASILMRIDTNWPSLLFDKATGLSVNTRAMVVLSYLFR